MIRNVIRFLRHIGYALINLIRRFYWFLVRPHTRGVKCIIEHEGKILFVRLSYSHKGWTLPGGKVEKGESFENAARRETFEEVGITVSNLVKVGEYISTKEYKIDTVKVFYAQTERDYFKVDGFEIVEACWAFPNNLPNPHPERLAALMSSFLDFKRS